MEKYYSVGGHLFCISLKEESFWSRLDNYLPFEVERSAAKPLFKVEVVDELPEAEQPREPFLSDETAEEDMPRVDVFRVGSGWLFDFYPTAVSHISFPVWMSSDFHLCRLKRWNVCQAGRFPLDNAAMLAYVMAAVSRKTLGIHASVIENGGRAFVFLGESGTGKSTHSRLWLRHIAGSRLMNDDNPVVRIEEDGTVRVYGTPWSGKTPCYRNESAPVAAFVGLAQYAENRMYRLPVLESYLVLDASTSGLRQLPSMEEELFQTLRGVLERIPCYHLDCLPDAEAAQLCASTCGVDGESGASAVAGIPQDEVLPVIGTPRKHSPRHDG